MEKSQEWTESPILDEDNNVELSIDQVRSEVEDYALRAYTMVSACTSSFRSPIPSAPAGHIAEHFIAKCVCH
eukprot:scaffold3119_cov20-Tisochrysis_lutea.AAC.2